jgi:predicted TIM-barrel fold metal-dependent hydrolase
MSIIDTHTHVFPDDKAAQTLAYIHKVYNARSYGEGTVSDLLKKMDEAEVDRAIIHMVSATPNSVREFNDWLFEIRDERLIKFGTIHPLMKDYGQELQRLVDEGVIGVKLQPDVQNFDVDDEAIAFPLYENIVKRNLVTMFHVGEEPAQKPAARSKPHKIRTVARRFPELTIIAAHLGGLNMWAQSEEHLVGERNVFFETSLTYLRIPPDRAERIIRNHGIHKVFFGTDYPFAPVRKSVQRAKRVPFLNDDEKAQIFSRNLEAFLGGLS